jgi:sec-independent protein translocase protein TatA
MSTGLLNPTHIIILLLVVLIVLGPKRLPQAGRSLGRGMREFRDGISGRDEPSEQPPAPPALMTAAPPPPVNTAAITPEQPSERPEAASTIQAAD